MADLKFLKGSSVRFNSLSKKDPDYFYLVSNTDGTIDFYLGDKLIAKGSTIDSLIAEIKARQDGDAELQRQIDTLDLSGALSNLKLSDSPVDGQYISSVSQTDGLISVTRANLPDYSEVYASKSIENSVTANTKAISILTGTGEGSVSDAVSKGIASVVGENADDAFDTLKEIADYIQGVPQNVVGLTNTVNDLSGRMKTAEGEIDALQESAKSAHSHGNKALLDTYSQTEESLADAVAKKHEHANLTVLNGITNDNVTEWNKAKTYAEEYATSAKTEAISQASALAAQALTDAKTDIANALDEAKEYADGLASNYDAAGAAASAAAQALVDAKEYADGKFQVKGNYEEAGAAADALASAKSYADGLASNYDGAGSAAQALVDAKAYADGLATNYDKSGSAAAAEANAKSYADGLASNYDGAGSAAKALTDAKAYADGLGVKYDAAGSASAAETAAKAYADGLAVNYDSAGAASAAETAAKAYADGLAVNYDSAGAADGALASAKADATTKANAAESAAKAYADGLAKNYDGAGAAASAAAQALADAKADAAAKYALQTALDAEISQRKGLLGSDNIQVEMNSETGIQTIKLIWGEF